MLTLENESVQSARFLDATAEFAALELERHNQERQKRNPIPYHQILTREAIHELSGEPQMEVEPDTQQVLMGNLLVENGHAEYDRVTSEVFERQSNYRDWKNTWVAEEQPHGPSIQTWAMITGYLSMQEVHDRTQGFLTHGLTLAFHTPAHGLAYPALQEPATKMSHSEAMRRLPKPKESLAASIGRNLMGNVIGDEAGHETFYTNMVRHSLETEDIEVVSAQMIALADAVLGFSMPGIEKDIPGGDGLTQAYKRTGVFTFERLGEKIILPAIGPEDIYGWKIDERVSMSDKAKELRDLIVEFAHDLLANEGRMGRVIIRARRQHGLMAASS